MIQLCSRTRSTTSRRRATSPVSFEEPEYTAQLRRAGHVARAGSGPHPGSRGQDPRSIRRPPRALRPGAGDAADARTTPFYPRSPTASPSCMRTGSRVNYREAYGFFDCNGGSCSITRSDARRDLRRAQITRALARIKLGPAGPACISASCRHGATGVMRGIRRGTVADPAAGRSGGLRHRSAESSTLSARFRNAAAAGSGIAVEWRGQ
mgnify:CR=1 FL=1